MNRFLLALVPVLTLAVGYLAGAGTSRPVSAEGVKHEDYFFVTPSPDGEMIRVWDWKAMALADPADPKPMKVWEAHRNWPSYRLTELAPPKKEEPKTD